MKRINIPAILFCLILAAGCSQDEPATENPDNGNATGKQITVTAAMPDTRVDTRLAYEDETNDAGTGKLVVKWKESGEKIYLYNVNKETASTLTQQANTLSEDGKKTDFTGKLPDNTEAGDVLYAYYQDGITEDSPFSVANGVNVLVDINSDGGLATIKHAMHAKTTYQGGQGEQGESNVSFSFQPLTAALKLTLGGIPSGVTITSLQLSGMKVFGAIYVYFYNERPPSYSSFGSDMKKIENLSLSSTNNVFYTGLFPGTLSDGMLITATGSDGNEYSATLPSIEIEAGNVYVAKVMFVRHVSTTQELRDALVGTNTNPIVIDGDLIYDYNKKISLGADHTLTINSGATLTLNYVGFSCEDYTLTINGGGKLITETASTEALDGGNVKLENVTIELLRRMYDVDIEVGNGAVIVVDAENIETPIYIPTSTKKLTVKTGGRIEIKNFLNRGIHCAGTLHIDGGSITINGLGSTSGIFEGYGYAPCAVSNAAKLEISNGGTLASTVAGGTVYLGDHFGTSTDCTVTGAKGLFQAGDYTLDTDEEVQVGTTGADLQFGVYKWSTSTERFVWTSTY